ncbi:AraC family transcriptional regulator [Sneathiella glossodoripedis]|uniref:AraC family transcriptional regulator n=1 Tax=Sneathiella glossodoripedis TaxID=418853 RepID=UPI00046F9F29|nr:AraC family transcriptional regulator [Sneathiella glossodoripedis]
MTNYKYASYEERLQRVTTYIYEHLDNDIDLMHLAEVACMSPYHWHRIYKSVCGETITATVRRLRLARAAKELSGSDAPVRDIGIRAGYTNVQSFTRLFKQAYGLPPAEYRKNGSHQRYSLNPNEEETLMYQIRIENFPQTEIAGMNHSGSYMDIGATFDKMFGAIGDTELDWTNKQLLALYFDDPNSVPEKDLRSFVAITVEDGFSAEPPLQKSTVRGGRYAILRHQGPYAEMQKAYDWLYGKWLVSSGEEAADAPCIEIYLNSPSDTPAAELLTEIYLPIK